LNKYLHNIVSYRIALYSVATVGDANMKLCRCVVGNFGAKCIWSWEDGRGIRAWRRADLIPSQMASWCVCVAVATTVAATIAPIYRVPARG